MATYSVKSGSTNSGFFDEIVDAVAAASSDGDTVIVYATGDGVDEFHETASATISANNVTIKVNPGDSIIWRHEAGSETNNYLAWGGAYTGITIQGFHFDASSASNDLNFHAQSGVRQFAFTDCTFSNWGPAATTTNGILYEGGNFSYFTASRCVFYNTAGPCIGATKELQVDNCLFYNCSTGSYTDHSTGYNGEVIKMHHGYSSYAPVTNCAFIRCGPIGTGSLAVTASAANNDTLFEHLPWPGGSVSACTLDNVTDVHNCIFVHCMAPKGVMALGSRAAYAESEWGPGGSLKGLNNNQQSSATGSSGIRHTHNIYWQNYLIYHADSNDGTTNSIIEQESRVNEMAAGAGGTKSSASFGTGSMYYDLTGDWAEYGDVTGGAGAKSGADNNGDPDGDGAVLGLPDYHANDFSLPIVVRKVHGSRARAKKLLKFWMTGGRGDDNVMSLYSGSRNTDIQGVGYTGTATLYSSSVSGYAGGSIGQANSDSSLSSTTVVAYSGTVVKGGLGAVAIGPYTTTNEPKFARGKIPRVKKDHVLNTVQDMARQYKDSGLVGFDDDEDCEVIPFSLAVRGPSNMRKRDIPYSVSQGGNPRGATSVDTVRSSSA